MTDVIIQHLVTEQKVRIKCRDYVKKIAVYKDRLAVQLSDKVVIYELLKDEDSYEMHYRVSTKIQKSMDCNLLVVTSRHVILCLEKKLQLFSFEGLLEREWVLEAVIRYIKSRGWTGGTRGHPRRAQGRRHPQNLHRQPVPHAARETHLRDSVSGHVATAGKIAAVDEKSSVVVYDLETKNLVFEDQNANSVSWNSEFEDMLCYSGGGQLSIKTGDFPVHRQKLQGFVVGFKGSKVFCLHQVHMQTIDVPQSISMMRYLRQKDFDSAYATACLGVTDGDWRQRSGTARSTPCNSKLLGSLSSAFATCDSLSSSVASRRGSNGANLNSSSAQRRTRTGASSRRRRKALLKLVGLRRQWRCSQI